MVPFSGRRAAIIAAVCVVCVGVVTPPASAQSINFNGGASIDPEQVYAGVSWESQDIGGRLRIRPGIDGGFGDGLRIAAINLDFITTFQLGGSPWRLIQGGGPVISISRFTDFDDSPRKLHAGGSYLFGFRHDNGFFTEFRIGGGGFVPQLKLGAGWSIEMK